MERETHILMNKIKTATEIQETIKDYIEILKISPKLKRTFNTQVIDEQIEVNEKIIKELVETLNAKQ